MKPRSILVAAVAAVSVTFPMAAATSTPAGPGSASSAVMGPVEVVDGASQAEGRTVGMVVDESGTATAVWERFGVGLYAAQRSPSGTWSSPQAIGCQGDAVCNEPVVGVDATGQVTVVWWQSAARDDIMVATKDLGGSWSTPLELTRGPGREQGYEPRLAVAPDGAAVVSWLALSDHRTVVLRKPAGRDWTRAVPVSFRRFVAMDLATGDGGTVVVVGQDSFEVRNPKTLAHVFRPRHGWQPTVVLGRGGGGLPGAYAAVGRRGSAAVAWAAGTANDARSAVMVRRMSPRYRWGPATRISRWRGQSSPAIARDVVIDCRGRVTVLWNGRHDTATTRVADGRWVSRRPAAAGTSPFGDLHTNASGVLAVGSYVLDHQANPYREEVLVDVRPANSLSWLHSPSLGTAFGGDGERGDPGSRPFLLGVRPDGSVLVAWFDPSQALLARTFG